MRMTCELKLVNILPITLDTREAANRLADVVRERNECKQIVLDFWGIEFISRSFADQLYKELYLHDKESFDIVIKNADATITRMLDAVSKTQAKRRVVKRTH
ncbi:DUF4325 domain-containing protein, partial [Parapedobacter sp. ISTM3]